jgi:hypothetical protein
MARPAAAVREPVPLGLVREGRRRALGRFSPTVRGGDRSAGWYRVRTCQALFPVARELPERDDANLLLVVSSHDRCTDAVRCIAVVIDEGDSLAPQPELFAGVKSIVFHQLSSAVSTAT